MQERKIEGKNDSSCILCATKDGGPGNRYLVCFLSCLVAFLASCCTTAPYLSTAAGNDLIPAPYSPPSNDKPVATIGVMANGFCQSGLNGKGETGAKLGLAGSVISAGKSVFFGFDWGVCGFLSKAALKYSVSTDALGSRLYTSSSDMAYGFSGNLDGSFSFGDPSRMFIQLAEGLRYSFERGPYYDRRVTLSQNDNLYPAMDNRGVTGNSLSWDIIKLGFVWPIGDGQYLAVRGGDCLLVYDLSKPSSDALGINEYIQLDAQKFWAWIGAGFLWGFFDYCSISLNAGFGYKL